MTGHLLYYSSLYALSGCKLKVESIQPSKLIMKSSPQGTPTQETEAEMILLECMWEQMKNDTNWTVVHDSKFSWHPWIITLLWSDADIDLLSCNTFSLLYISRNQTFEIRSCLFVEYEIPQGSVDLPCLMIELVAMVWRLSASWYCSVLEVASGMRNVFFLEVNVFSVCLGCSVSYSLL